MLCIRENEKTPDEKACFLSRRFLVFINPWKQKTSDCLIGTLLAD